MKKKLWKKLMVFTLALIMFIGILPAIRFVDMKVYAYAVSLSPTNDTFIDDIYFTAGAGGSGDVASTPYAANWVGTSGGYVENAKSALNFDVSAVTGIVTDAKLRLYTAALPNGPTTFDLYSSNDDTWTEASTTIPVQTNLLQSGINVSTENTWIEIDVTSYIDSEKTVDGVVSFVLTASNIGSVFAYVSDEDTNYKPELLVISSENSTISSTTGTFDKNTSAQVDVTTTMTLKGNTLDSITNDGAPLVKDTDYTISGSTVTITKEYLETQAVGTTNLVFNFSAGDPQTLSIAISDTTPAITSTVIFKDYDGTIIGEPQTIIYGQAATAPTEPTRVGFSFIGWDIAFDNVINDLVVTAMYSIAGYSVTFKDYDGTVIGTPQSIAHGGAAIEPTAPVRTGHNFIGWDKTFDNITSDLTVTAMYGANGYSVTFKDYDGTELDTPQTVVYGDAAIAPVEPTRDGFVFIGWDKTFDNINNDLIVTAMYVSQNSLVTYTDYDGTVIGTPQTVTYGGTSIAPTEPTREGYRFTGWNMTSDSSTGDITLTATYELNQYTVTFRDYDGTVIGIAQSVTYGNAATAPTFPSREGYSFVGWDTVFDNVTSDLTVTASYGVRYFTVIFKDNEGVVIGDSQTVAYGDAAIVPEVPVKEGYTFKNWDIAFDNVKENLVVTGSFEKNYYTVVFKDYDGTEMGTTQIVAYGDPAVAPAEPTREGYTFKNWDTAFDKVAGNLIVTATYEIKKYTVTFYDYDGTVIGTPQGIEYGKSAIWPEEPVRVGYKFAGWDKSFDNIIEDLSVTATYTTGLTYTMPLVTIDPNTKELKTLIGYFESGKNTIVVNNEVANLIIPTNVVEATDIVGAEYIKFSQKIITDTSKEALTGKIPSDLKLVGNIIDFTLQLFDQNDALIKDIHEFDNNEKVKISVKLTSDIIMDMDTSKLSMYYYDDDNAEWIELGGSFDKVAMEFNYYTTHFTKFAIMENQETILVDNTDGGTGSSGNTNDGTGTSDNTNDESDSSNNTDDETGSSDNTNGGSGSSDNTDQATSSSGTENQGVILPKTGSPLDTKVLVLLGGMLILGGVSLIVGISVIRKRREKSNRNM